MNPFGSKFLQPAFIGIKGPSNSAVALSWVIGLIGPASTLAVERGRADTEHPRRLRQRATAGTDGCLDNKALDLGQGHSDEGIDRCRKFTLSPGASARRLGPRDSRRFGKAGHAADAGIGVDDIAAAGAQRRDVHRHHVQVMGKIGTGQNRRVRGRGRTGILDQENRGGGGGINTHLSVDLFLNVFEHPINLAEQPLHIALDLCGIVAMAGGVHLPGPLLHRQGANSAGNRDQDMGH